MDQPASMDRLQRARANGDHDYAALTSDELQMQLRPDSIETEDTTRRDVCRLRKFLRDNAALHALFGSASAKWHKALIENVPRAYRLALLPEHVTFERRTISIFSINGA